MIRTKEHIVKEGPYIHWLTIVSSFLCMTTFFSLWVMTDPALFGNPFFLGSLPFIVLLVGPLLAIIAGVSSLFFPQHMSGRGLAKLSLVAAGLLLLTELILLTYAYGA